MRLRRRQCMLSCASPHRVDEDEIYCGRRKRDAESAWPDNSAHVISQLAQCFTNAMVGSRAWIGGILSRSSNKRFGSDKIIDYTPTPEEEESLHKLQERLGVPFDESQPDHQEALLALWNLAFPDVKLNSLISEQWKDMGWQGTNPSTDFRHYLASCVKEGGFAFKKAHGKEIFEMASENAELNKIVNDGMKSTTEIISKAIVSVYRDRFTSVGSLVDIGGGTGAAVAEIVKAFPHIKGINFDLPHVVATAPDYGGVSHVGGDMFESIPAADVLFIKWVLHDWGDEDCVKILNNCRKALPEKTGKLIIVDAVLKAEGDEIFGDTCHVIDLVMMAHSSGGKERTEEEWKKLLAKGGFPNYNIIKIPTWSSIIEAYSI